MKKRLLALLMGALLTVSTCIPTFAAETTAANNQKHFTLSAASFDADLAKIINDADAAGYVDDANCGGVGTKRLVIYKGYQELTSDFNAIAAASDNEMTVLQFGNDKDAKKAYDYYVEKYGTSIVFYDHIETIADDYVADAEEVVVEDSVDVVTDSPEYFAIKMGADKFVKQMSTTMKNKKLVVAILDTGLNTEHEKIKGKWVKGVSYYNNGSIKDGHNHGTMTSGCVLGVTKGTNVKVMPCKVMSDSGRGYSSDIIAGMKYAMNNGAKILNMSLGGDHGSSCTCYDEIMKTANSKKVTVVVSAGNSNEDIDTWGVHPAAYRSCITVAATDKNDEKAWFSNYGKAVDVTSYGVDIYMPTCSGKNTYTYNSGTSFSCPLTAGAAALVYAGEVATTPSGIEKILRSKAKDLGTKGYDIYYGAGTVRIGAIKVAGKTGFSSEKITLKVGDKKGGLFSNPKKLSVTFTSDSKKIATVSSKGVITAKKIGETMIKAKAGGKAYYLRVKVIQPRIKGASVVKKGKTITLKMADVSGTTKWYSSNKKVATVTSKGVVKGIKKGTVNIVAINNGIAYIKKITVK